jgi:intracellular multiplication protein IcmC
MGHINMYYVYNAKVVLNSLKKWLRILFLPALCFFVAPSAWATSTYNATDMLLNLQKSLPGLFNLAVGGAYVMGVALTLKGIYDLKIYGESRTMMSSHTNIKGPLMTLFVGAMCIFSPSAFSVVMESTFGYSSVLSYNQFPTSSGQALSQSEIVILQIIQVIGAYAFVRGWVLLARSSSGQGGHGLFGRGLIHVIGGVFAINIVGTCNVIAATFGITF